ncbi:tyrosine-type recombinase/integrase [Methylorubrum sp. GM97]|uniref:tyrosine-type recombinase/integrase n=1 Tax=Methylorubrum sp. GM97 TaxID=2938232 RepID=UPI0021C49B59|nr:site-specific integrase [Methylorubrum sp. GM97]
MAAAGDRAAYRFLKFFTAQIRNPNTCRAYVMAVGKFCTWLKRYGLRSITDVSSIHIAVYVEELGRSHSASTVEQRLAAIRMMFDWLATGGVLPFNPVSGVRGSKHVVKRGKPPVLPPDEARAILDAIDVSTPIGLRDRALIELMVYSFARIGAATAMRVEDVYVQNRRLWGGCTRRTARRWTCPATTTWKPTCTPTWTAPASPATVAGRCFARSGAVRAN